MVNAPKATKAINSFVFTKIPSPRDVFMRYGARSSSGELSTSREEVSAPALPNCASVIDQTIYAEALLSRETTKH